MNENYNKKYWCHECYKKHLREYYKNNKSKYKKYQLNESFKKYQKEYKKKYIGKRNDYFRDYYEKNKGKKYVTEDELNKNFSDLKYDVQKYEQIIYLVGVLGYKKYVNPLLFKSIDEHLEYVKFVDLEISNNFS